MCVKHQSFQFIDMLINMIQRPESLYAERPVLFMVSVSRKPVFSKTPEPFDQV